MQEPCFGGFESTHTDAGPKTSAKKAEEHGNSMQLYMRDTSDDGGNVSDEVADSQSGGSKAVSVCSKVNMVRLNLPCPSVKFTKPGHSHYGSPSRVISPV